MKILASFFLFAAVYYPILIAQLEELATRCNMPEVAFVAPPDTCSRTAIFEARVNVAYDSIVYNWYYEGQMINKHTPRIEVHEFGQYAVDISTVLNGVAQVTQQTFVFEGRVLEIEEVIVKNASCNESNGSVRISVNDETGIRYSLNGEDFQKANFFDNLAAGNYIITVRDSLNCKDTQTVAIGLGSLPIIKKLEAIPATCGEKNGAVLFEISEGTGVITPSINGDALGFNNSFQDLAPGEYMVTFTDEVGCAVSSTISVAQLPCSIYVPNAFSPNGDGVNDLFQVRARPGLNGRINTYLIFDRWGTKLYEAHRFFIDSSDHWWDGTCNDQRVGAGTYIYYLEIEFQQGVTEILQGAVQIVN